MGRKCFLCPVCNGKACIEQLPGMGGVDGNRNFILNFEGWAECGSDRKNSILLRDSGFEGVRLAPMTGAVENAGYADEKSFYFDMISFCAAKKMKLSIGDGVPDEKLFFGIQALEAEKSMAAVFIKPYPNEKILSRFERALGVAEVFGVDIDAYNIVTMRNKCSLEKKDERLLLELKDFCGKKNIPFAVKGIFTEEDVALAEKVRPDIAFVSNHGGRIETGTGSTAAALRNFAARLKSCSGKIWVDGGIRYKSDVEAAKNMGADEVLVGRPVVTELVRA